MLGAICTLSPQLHASPLCIRLGIPQYCLLIYIASMLPLGCRLWLCRVHYNAVTPLGHSRLRIASHLFLVQVVQLAVYLLVLFQEQKCRNCVRPQPNKAG